MIQLVENHIKKNGALKCYEVWILPESSVDSTQEQAIPTTMNVPTHCFFLSI